MSDLNLAQQFAWSLATTLMTCVILFRGETGYGVVPAAEFEGDPMSIIREVDPFDR